MKQKKLFLSVLVTLFLSYFNSSQLVAQNPFWTFPEQRLDYGFGFNQLPTDDYTGSESDYVHAGLKDPYGEIMFFMMDAKLYDATGEETAEFDDGTELIRGYSEALVVPQPGSCNRFYIFQALTTSEECK